MLLGCFFNLSQKELKSIKYFEKINNEIMYYITFICYLLIFKFEILYNKIKLLFSTQKNVSYALLVFFIKSFFHYLLYFLLIKFKYNIMFRKYLTKGAQIVIINQNVNKIYSCILHKLYLKNELKEIMKLFAF